MRRNLEKNWHSPSARNPRSQPKAAPLGTSALPRSAFDDACRFLGRRRLTEAEIHAKLSRNFSQTEIKKALVKLKEYRFIEDEALVVDHIRDRMQFSPRSANLIAVELERRGIAPERFQQIFERVFPDYDESQVAMTALQQHFKDALLQRWRRQPAQKSREQALRFLHGRGFGYEVMIEAWEEFRSSSRSDDSQEIYEE